MKPFALSSLAAACEFEGQGWVLYNKTIPKLPLQIMAQPIGSFYGRLANRLLTYLLLAAGMIGGAFWALGIAGKAAFMLQGFPRACALALYLAAVFTVSHVLADLAANHLWPLRMAYGSRSVGGQWMVLFGGLALGFWAHQGAFPELMRLCAQGPDSHLPISLSVVPLWCATLYACLLTVPMSDNETGREEAGAPARPLAAQAAIPGPRPARQPKPATASFRINGRQVKIPLQAISHDSI